MRPFSSVLLPLCVLLAGCGAYAPPTVGTAQVGPLRARVTTEDWYPVKVGLRWTYRTLFRHEGTPEREGQPHVFAITRAGREGARLERSYGGTQALPSRIVKTENEVRAMRWLEEDPAPNAHVVLLRLPPVTGARWQGRPLAGGAEETISCEGESPLTVEGKTYQALEVRHRITRPGFPTDESNYWYARGVGMVRAVERLTILVGTTPRRLEAELLLRSVEESR
ncbi:MAG: hypothetical protein VKO21_02240 [Candidatus Sericytochromatia bacterium]|nr:hypothetical protein [Candidatus Sericytochromatia bacterium]